MITCEQARKLLDFINHHVCETKREGVHYVSQDTLKHMGIRPSDMWSSPMFLKTEHLNEPGAVDVVLYHIIKQNLEACAYPQLQKLETTGRRR